MSSFLAAGEYRNGTDLVFAAGMSETDSISGTTSWRLLGPSCPTRADRPFAHSQHITGSRTKSSYRFSGCNASTCSGISSSGGLSSGACHERVQDRPALTFGICSALFTKSLADERSEDEDSGDEALAELDAKKNE